MSHIARDPLDPAFDDVRFVAMVRKRASGIKRVLLDQGVVSGIGNIYADESLWAAKLHYDRPAERLTRSTCSCSSPRSAASCGVRSRTAARASTRSTST